MLPPIAQTKSAAQESDAPSSPHGELSSYQTFLESRPPVFETCAIEEILSLAHLAPALHLHIVHLSAVECIPILKKARSDGINITAETCFHYLGMSAEDIGKGDTRHKCCPPIRGSSNRNGRWEELVAADSCIKTIVSDHSPCTPQLKLLPAHLDRTSASTTTQPISSDTGATTASQGTEACRGDFLAAWGGISSVGLGLPILHTAAKRRSETAAATPSLTDIVRLCCQKTAEQVGLSHRKGALKVGMDADVCVFDDSEVWTLSEGDMRWKNRCSPWEGHEFTGRVTETWLRGRKVFELHGADGGFPEGKPFGESITEKRMV